MGLELAKAWVRVRADSGQVGADLKRAKPAVMSAVGDISQAANTMIGNIGAMVVARTMASLRQMVTESISLAERQINAEQRVAGVIKATGGAAGYTVEQMKKYASALQASTTFGDEAILESLGVLMTFRKIGGKQLKEAQERVLDVATAMGTDARSGAIQFGKALEDPIRGTTALSRAGVTFTDVQKKQIKALVESGNLLEAQEIILNEVKQQVGGLAKEMAKTDAGKLQQAKNVLGDMKEEIGRKLIPIYTQFVGLQMKLLEVLTPIIDHIIRNIDVYKNLVVAIGGVIAAYLAYRVAMKAAAVAQAIVMAMSGPTGWAKLAVGIAVAAGAVMLVNNAFAETDKQAKKVSNQANEVQKSLDKIKGPEIKIGPTEKEFAAAKDKVQNLYEEVWQLKKGWTETQKAVYDFSKTKGATPELISQFTRLRKVMDEFKEKEEWEKTQQEAAKRLEEEGRNLAESLRTPMEEYRDEVANIQRLLQEGVISAETARRGMIEAEEERRGGMPGIERIGFADLGKKMEQMMNKRERTDKQIKMIDLLELGTKKQDELIKVIREKDMGRGGMDR